MAAVAELFCDWSSCSSGGCCPNWGGVTSVLLTGSALREGRRVRGGMMMEEEGGDTAAFRTPPIQGRMFFFLARLEEGRWREERRHSYTLSLFCSDTTAGSSALRACYFQWRLCRRSGGNFGEAFDYCGFCNAGFLVGKACRFKRCHRDRMWETLRC